MKSPEVGAVRAWPRWCWCCCSSRALAIVFVDRCPALRRRGGRAGAAGGRLRLPARRARGPARRPGRAGRRNRRAGRAGGQHPARRGAGGLGRAGPPVAGPAGRARRRGRASLLRRTSWYAASAASPATCSASSSRRRPRSRSSLLSSTPRPASIPRMNFEPATPLARSPATRWCAHRRERDIAAFASAHGAAAGGRRRRAPPRRARHRAGRRAPSWRGERRAAARRATFALPCGALIELGAAPGRWRTVLRDRLTEVALLAAEFAHGVVRREFPGGLALRRADRGSPSSTPSWTSSTAASRSRPGRVCAWLARRFSGTTTRKCADRSGDHESDHGAEEGAPGDPPPSPRQIDLRRRCSCRRSC